MVYREEIAALEQQKEFLVSRGDLQRVNLALELRQLQTGTHILGRLLAWRQHARFLLLPGMALAGYLLSRRQVRGLLMKGFVGWTLWHRTQRLRTLLRWVVPRR